MNFVTPVARRIMALSLGLALVAASGAFQPAMAQAVQPINSAKMMFIGHSLINLDLPDIVRAMAQSKGLIVRRHVQWIIGSSIGFNWANCRSPNPSAPPADANYACDALDRGTDIGPYDSLIITQNNNPIINPGNPSDYGASAVDYEKFLELFLSRNPSGRGFFYTSWEDLDSPWHNGQDWTTQISRELTAFERIADGIEQVALANHGRNVTINVIPAALGLRDLIVAAESGQFPGVTSRSQLFTDKVHLSGMGYYMVACIVYASVFQQSPAGATAHVMGDWGNTYVDLPSDLALRIQNLAWQTVSNYRGWSGTAVRPRAPTSLRVQ
jgi:hypothetical protein